MLRVVFVLLGLLFGLAFAAGTAGAHATTSPVTAAEHDHADAHKHADAHEHGEHHTHDIGEDTYHQKASHCSLDFAYMGRTAAFVRVATPVDKIVAANDAAHGIVLTPPVPPPLA
jgi:hypothetical protein